MPIELPDDARAEAISSIKEYTRENFDEPLGDLASGFLLDFFLADIGPSIYNKAVAEAAERMQAKVMDVEVEVHEPEFTYWKNLKKR
ncbi:MAG: hypothetical protein ACI80V_003819 [Rhodothermales bacterium]|jgi:uncharacterized protein (DUF2164 family)